MKTARISSVSLVFILASCNPNPEIAPLAEIPKGNDGEAGEDIAEERTTYAGEQAEDEPLRDEHGDPIVLLEQQELYAPREAQVNPPPSELNWIRYFRYRLQTESGKRRSPDIVLLFTPGLTCGANVYYHFGHELLKMAFNRRQAWFELLVVERRSNQLEDTRGMEFAEQLRDTQIARDYYWNGKVIDGQKFAGFLTDKDVPYLAEFGLEAALDDVYRVLLAEVPDRQDRQNKVFVGGHSQAGTTTAFFAGWDFDRNPSTLEDAGYQNAAGYVALDCRIDIQGNGETDRARVVPLDFDVDMLTEARYSRLLRRMLRGDGRVMLPFEDEGLSREIFLVMELLAMEADFAPEKESSLLEETPLTDGTHQLLRVLHSKNLLNFVGVGPSITDFRYTNEALFGVILDNNFMPFDGVKTAIGFLDGGKISPKRFPYPKAISKIPFIDSIFGRMMDDDGLFIADDSGSLFRPKPLYRWRHFDEIGSKLEDRLMSPDGRVTFTSVIEEVSDLHDYTKLFYKGSGNFLEWYYPLRFLMDLIAGKKGFGPKFGLHYFHGEHTDDLPRITLLGSVGTGRPGKTDAVGPNELYFLEGYNHIDLLVASASRPDIRENEVIPPIIEFALKHKGP